MLTPLLTALVSRDARVSVPESAANSAGHLGRLKHSPDTENIRCTEFGLTA
jgi:hypothetical protein